MRRIILSVAPVVLVAALSASQAFADSVVNVTPANMNGWALNSFDGNFNEVNSGPYYGTAAMATGPATPPLGTGSAHLATPVGFGDGAAAIATDNFDGIPLALITSLSYSAYDVTNNGSQFPYLAVSIDTHTAAGIDTMIFEPPYQTASTGNSSLPDQGATMQGVWQNWNAEEGGWWDGNIGGDGGTNVQPLSAFLAAYPLATIANNGFPGLGGIALQVGFGSPGETEDGYVDAFTIGVAGVNTTFNFDPNPAAPEPAEFVGLIGMAGIGLVLIARRRRLRVALR